MTTRSTKQASLTDIKRMRERGELRHDPRVPEAESLGADFWAKATVEGPKKTRSVHLKLDPEIFDFFVSETNGKGHLTRMQNVLKAYVNAHRS